MSLTPRMQRWVRKFADDTLYAAIDAAIGPDFEGDCSFDSDLDIDGDLLVSGNLEVTGSLTFTTGALSLTSLDLDSITVDDISENTLGHGIDINHSLNMAASKQILDNSGSHYAAKRIKVTKNITDFAADALINDIELISLPTAAKILDVYAEIITTFDTSSVVDQAANWDGTLGGTIQLTDATGLNVGDYVNIDDDDSGRAYGYIVSISANLGDGAALYDLVANWDGTAGGFMQTASDPSTAGVNVGSLIEIDDNDSPAVRAYCVSMTAQLGDGAATYDINFSQDGLASGVLEIDSDPVTAGVNPSALVEIDGNAPLVPVRGYVNGMTANLGDGLATYNLALSWDGDITGIAQTAADPTAAGMTVGARVQIDDGDSDAIRAYATAISAQLGDGAATYDIAFDEDGTLGGQIIVASDPSAAGMNLNSKVEIDETPAATAVRGYVDSITIIGAGAAAYDEAFIDIDGSVAGVCMIADSSAMSVGEYVEIDETPAAVAVRGYITNIDVIGAGVGTYDKAFFIDGAVGGTFTIEDDSLLSVGDYVEIDETPAAAAVRGYISTMTDYHRAGQGTYSYALTTTGGNGFVEVAEADAANIIVNDYIEVHDDVEAADLRGWVVGKLDLGATWRIFVQDAVGGGGANVDFSAYGTLPADNALVRAVTETQILIVDEAAAPIDLSAYTTLNASHMYSVDASKITIEDAPVAGAPVDISAYTLLNSAHIYSLAAWSIMIVDTIGGAATDLSAYTLALASHVYSIDNYEITLEDAAIGGAAVDISAYSVAQAAAITSLDCWLLTIEDALVGGAAVDLSTYTVLLASHMYSIDAYELGFEDAPLGGAPVNLSAFTVAQAAHMESIDAYELHIQDAAVGGADVNLTDYNVAQNAHVFMDCTGVTISVGPTGVAAGLMLANDVYTAAGLLTAEAYKGADLTNPGRSNMYSTAAVTSIRAYITSAGLVLDQLTDGEIDFYIEYMD